MINCLPFHASMANNAICVTNDVNLCGVGRLIVIPLFIYPVTVGLQNIYKFDMSSYRLRIFVSKTSKKLIERSKTGEKGKKNFQSH